MKKDKAVNCSYEEGGVMKATVNIVVPRYLVSLLIGKDGESVKRLNYDSGCIFRFHHEVLDEYI